jgi:protein-disulfide isomerase/uncharacterized membrane protein
MKTSSNKTSWNLFILITIIGWINALVTLWHREKLHRFAMESSSFCNISEKINCDTVALSEWSALLGFPTAAWGLLFYAVLMLIALWSYFKLLDGEEQNVASGAAWLFAITTLSLVPTAGLAAISFFKIGSLCLLCLLTYLVNILLAILAYGMYKDSKGSSSSLSTRLQIFTRSFGQTWWIVAAITLALHVFSPTIVGQMATGAKDSFDDKTLSYVLQSYATSPKVNLLLDTYPSFGPTDAKITVVEYSDFQCPYCARSSVVVTPLLKSYGNLVRYVYKPYPLDSACNPNMNRSPHPLACLAAKIGQCVFEQKGSNSFFEFKKSVFDSQSKLSTDLIKSFATNAGLDSAQTDACLADPKGHQQIVDSVKEGSKVGVEGTPSIFINGRKVDAGPHPKVIRAVIDYLLRQQ